MPNSRFFENLRALGALAVNHKKTNRKGSKARKNLEALHSCCAIIHVAMYTLQPKLHSSAFALLWHPLVLRAWQ